MIQAVLTLNLPDDVYERVRRAAKGMKQPLEKALIDIVRAATPSLEKIPPQYRAELEAIEECDDQTLWKMAESHLSPAKQRRLERLLDANQRRPLSERQRQDLLKLHTEADRLLLKRSYAFLLLKYRGHAISNLGDVTRP